MDPYGGGEFDNSGEDHIIGGEESDDSESSIASTQLGVLGLTASDITLVGKLSVVDISSPTEIKLELDANKSSILAALVEQTFGSSLPKVVLATPVVHVL